MPEIVHNPGAGLHAERVDCAHVAEDWTVAVGLDANVVDMIEPNQVVGGQGLAVAQVQPIEMPCSKNCKSHYEAVDCPAFALATRQSRCETFCRRRKSGSR